MKYYKIEIKGRYPELGRIASSAEGKDVEDAEYYFDKMAKGEIVNNAPLFDYFYLESFDKREYWEWQLNDVHSFIGEGSQIQGWLISEKLKKLFEKFKISKPYYFYPSKLLFKNEKLDYYIFQFSGGNIIEKIREKMNFEHCVFFDPNNDKDIFVNSKDEFVKEKKRIMKESRQNNKDSKIEIKKIVLNSFKLLKKQKFQEFLVFLFCITT